MRKKKNPAKAYQKKKCDLCGKFFKPRSGNQKFCSECQGNKRNPKRT